MEAEVPIPEGSEPPEGYSLILPFICVMSKGGPFEDNAFCAGWRCGEISRSLSFGPDYFLTLGQKPELEQLDLVAMHHGYTMRTEVAIGEGDGAWYHVEFFKVNQ